MWWIIAALLFTGIVLMFVEMLLIPGVGIAGILSFASFGAACWYAFSFIGRTAGIITTIIASIILIILIIIILRGKTWKRFELKTEVDSKVNVETEKVKVGDQGIAQTRLAPMGTGKFGGVYCEVKSVTNAMIAAGTPIEVVETEDNKVIVKPIEQ